MSEINEQVPSTILPIEEEEYNYCMYCPMMCANSYMLQEQMMREYNSEDSEYEEGYRPGPSHGPGGNPGPGHGPKIWHGHGGYYGNKYYKDINYFYYLSSRYYLYYPYDPYFDYYYNIY